MILTFIEVLDENSPWLILCYAIGVRNFGYCFSLEVMYSFNCNFEHLNTFRDILQQPL